MAVPTRNIQLYVPDDPDSSPILTIYRRQDGSPLLVPTVSGFKDISGRTTANYPEVSGSSFRPIDYTVDGVITASDEQLFLQQIALQESGYRVLVIQNYRLIPISWINWNNRAIYGSSVVDPNNSIVSGYYQFYAIIRQVNGSQFLGYDGEEWRSITFDIVEVPGSGAIGQGEISGSSSEQVLSTPAYAAAQNLTAPIAVTLNGSDQWVDASADEPTHINATVALLLATLTTGQSSNAIANGIVTDTGGTWGWSWTQGTPIYLGLNGALTQTNPGAPNFRREVATVLSSDTIYWNPQEGVAQP